MEHRFTKGNQFAKGNPPNITSFKKGQHHSPETEFKKGCISNMKNKKHSIASKIKNSNAHEGKKLPNQSRENHWRWNGGIKKSSGYICILKPEHPLCDNQGYIREHRFIMEKHLGRHLKPEEIIHHLNGIKTDNRLENLALCNNQTHYLFIKRLQERILTLERLIN